MVTVVAGIVVIIPESLAPGEHLVILLVLEGQHFLPLLALFTTLRRPGVSVVVEDFHLGGGFIVVTNLTNLRVTHSCYLQAIVIY